MHSVFSVATVSCFAKTKMLILRYFIDIKCKFLKSGPVDFLDQFLVIADSVH